MNCCTVSATIFLLIVAVIPSYLYSVLWLSVSVY